MELQPYLIPYTTIISSTDMSVAEESILDICSMVRKLAGKFFTWIINQIKKVLTKLGILKEKAPKSEANAIAAKQMPHLDKALALSTEILQSITLGYTQFKLHPIRTSKTTALRESADKVEQKVSAARAEVAIVQDIGNGKLYIAPGSFDREIERCKATLQAAENCQEKVMKYFDELTKSGDAEFKAAATQDISKFNAAVTDFVSFYTVLTNMMLMIQLGNQQQAK